MDLLVTLLWAYLLLLGVRVGISWLNPDPRNPLVQCIYLATEPILERMRPFVPRVRWPVDLTPAVVGAGLYAVIVLVERLAG